MTIMGGMCMNIRPVKILNLLRLTGRMTCVIIITMVTVTRFIIDRYTIKELVKIPLQDLILLLVTLTHMREYKVLLTTTAITCIPEAVFTSILK
jgi:hypothetical protein